MDICGKPMVQHVYEKALAAGAERVIVATDDERIKQCAEGFGAMVCMTSSEHQSGTDRLAEAVDQLGLEDDAIVVNVQGDEPLMAPALIKQVAVNLFEDPSVGMATLCEPIDELDSITNPNIVKVVFDDLGHALYFSRSPIPYARSGDLNAVSYFRHIGLYSYRASFLRQFVTWDPSELERTESLEQLRALSNNVQIHVEPACEATAIGVDTEQDLDVVRRILERST